MKIKHNISKLSQLLLAFVAIAAGSSAIAGTLSFDLGDQWSATDNPDGAWSYDQGGAPLPYHQTNWSAIAGLNGWTTTSAGVLPPGWFLVTDSDAFVNADVGDVTVHSTTGAGAPAELRWTSCAAGTVDVAGEAWDVFHDAQRDDRWTLFISDTAVATRSSVLGLAKGAADASFANNTLPGQSLMSVAVDVYDTLLIEVVKSGSSVFGHFTGIELSVQLTTADDDGDGIDDAADNCSAAPNADQRDTDADGYGNACDADLNNDGQVNATDLGLLRMAFFQAGDLDADFNGDQVVNATDLGIMRLQFFGRPGPSCIASTAE